EVFYKTKYVILATGYYDQPNFLNIPGSSLPHVTHYFKEAHPYFNQKVVVIGGKNSAIDTALELYHANADVTLLYRGPDYSKSIKPWILPEFASLVKHNKVKVAFNANVIEIRSDVIRYEVDQEIIEEPIDFVFAMTGYHPQIELLKKLNVEVDLKSGRPEFNSDTYETNVTNLYVAGVIISGFESNETFIRSEIRSDVIRYEVDQEIIEEPIDFVFAMTGYHPQIELLKKLNVEVDLKSGRPEFNSDTYETNVTNLYVAGVIISGFESNETFI